MQDRDYFALYNFFQIVNRGRFYEKISYCSALNVYIQRVYESSTEKRQYH